MYMNKKPRSVEELNLERELAITKEVLESERAKITMLESHLGTYQFNFPAASQQVWNCVPYRIVPKKGAKFIEGYGYPYELVHVPIKPLSNGSMVPQPDSTAPSPLHIASANNTEAWADVKYSPACVSDVEEGEYNA